MAPVLLKIPPGTENLAFRDVGPEREETGLVRWHRADLKAMIEERFAVVYNERLRSRRLHELGFSHISARPLHPGQMNGPDERPR